MKDIQTEISLNNTRNQARNFTRNQNKHEQINQINTVRCTYLCAPRDIKEGTVLQTYHQIQISYY